MGENSPTSFALAALAIARSMLSVGILKFRARSTARRSLGFVAGSPPPSLAATLTARASLENKFPRLASVAAFLCLIWAHFECPDISGGRNLTNIYLKR